MRTVTGSTDRVVVVGAGLGGLACALHLAAAGRQVTVVERESVPGGRAGRLTVDGYDFDTGPTVLTMPELIEEPLAAVGEKLSDWLDLKIWRDGQEHEMRFARGDAVSPLKVTGEAPTRTEGPRAGQPGSPSRMKPVHLGSSPNASRKASMQRARDTARSSEHRASCSGSAQPSPAVGSIHRSTARS